MSVDTVTGASTRRGWSAVAAIAALAVLGPSGCGARSAVDGRSDTANRRGEHATEGNGTGTTDVAGTTDAAGAREATGELRPADGVSPSQIASPADPCAAIVPDPSWEGEPVFAGADPCERVRAECAWSVALRRCALAAPVRACPASVDEAAALVVPCDHSQQPALTCTYGETVCQCVRPSYCGGAPPPPPIQSPPATFACVPPFDDRGCPTGAVREGARCTLDPAVSCAGCTTIVRCERGRWRTQRLPPRP